MPDLTVVQAVDDFMAAATQAAMRTALGLGTIATQAASSVSISGGTIAGLTGLGIRNAGTGAFDLTLAHNGTLSVGRTLTFNVNDAARTISFAGNLTLAADFITSGANSLTLTTTGATNVTLPTAGTLAILGANTFTALQTITQATVNTGIIVSTGYSLTGSNATNMIDLAGTWNTSGTPTAFKLNITNTTSNASSLLIDLQVGASSRFNIAASTGHITSAGGFFGSGSINIQSTWGVNGSTGNQIMYSLGTFGWASGNGGYTATADALFARKTTAAIQMGADAAGIVNQMFTAASRITSDGVGANLTIAGGNGRGGAGGSLILSTYDTQATGVIGVLQTRITITTTGAIILAALPTSDPGVSGQLYKSAGVLMQSP